MAKPPHDPSFLSAQNALLVANAIKTLKNSCSKSYPVKKRYIINGRLDCFRRLFGALVLTKTGARSDKKRVPKSCISDRFLVCAV